MDEQTDIEKCVESSGKHCHLVKGIAEVHGKENQKKKG